ncbi:ABC transporter permease subunit [Permianibacter aggregans]|uniref:Putrescine transport system permease protein n=1 Tax=Permianibacter aggregans TaxID=1510150 RepID=A0A4R6UZS3_9GAMM|nr:ABC transporter permease subunit [Permianibacter aggregans]QGX41367.1 ABC transporter permease subunit [Permianibacter aggregans]TDQ51155.1 putrescine transport system permease protein [Permianibacter aggregans]
MQNRNSAFSWTWLGLGFAFLYMPMVLMVVYSFNESRLVTVWSQFSTKWYVELFNDTRMLEAAFTSLKIGVATATFAVLLGTLAAIVITRMGRFHGKTFFQMLMTAPLVMPEVITGLSLLLLFVAMKQFFGWPEGLGMTTVWIAHVTFTSAFTTVVVSSRLREVDNSIEEAARDLGAPPLKVFFVITLPIIAPALVSAWLLAFTLSIDDLVISSFVAGPGSTTLPMVVFSSVRLGVSPKINALATIVIGIVSVGIIIAGWFIYRAEKKLEREMEQASAEMAMNRTE